MMKTVRTVAAATKSARTVCPPSARYASSGPYDEEEMPSAPSPTHAKKAIRETLWKIFGSRRSRGAPSRNRFARWYQVSRSMRSMVPAVGWNKSGRRIIPPSTAGDGRERGRVRLQHPDGEDDHRQAGEHQPLLRHEGSLVVEQPGKQVLFPEDELSGKDALVGEILRHLLGQVCDAFDGVGPYYGACLSIVAVTLDELDVLPELLLQVIRQVLHLRGPLEDARVDHAGGDEDEVPEHPGELLHDGEEDVHPQPVVPGHHDDRRGGLAPDHRLLRHGDRRQGEEEIVQPPE